jgi:hypothetical protein
MLLRVDQEPEDESFIAGKRKGRPGNSGGLLFKGE